MYINTELEHALCIQFDENIYKQTVRKGNFFITRVLQKGTKPSEDKFFLSQIMVQNGEDVNITVKYCDNYKIYYYTEDKSTRITIEKIEEMNKNITNILFKYPNLFGFFYYVLHHLYINIKIAKLNLL